MQFHVVHSAKCEVARVDEQIRKSSSDKITISVQFVFVPRVSRVYFNDFNGAAGDSYEKRREFDLRLLLSYF